MFFECLCGRAFRVRKEGVPPPSKCPYCGGALRRLNIGAAPLAGPDQRVTDLERRVQLLDQALRQREAELARSQERVQALETQNSQAPARKEGPDLREVVQALEQQVQEAHRQIQAADRFRKEADEKIKALERQLQDAREVTEAHRRDLESGRGDTQGRLRIQEQLLSELRSRANEAAAGRVNAEARTAQLREEIERKERRIAELESELSSLRAAAERGSQIPEPSAPPPEPEPAPLADTGEAAAAEPAYAPEPREEGTLQAEAPPPEPAAPEAADAKGEPRRRGFLSRLFGRKR